ncbi:diguanylate cyclase (GGDEF)-like protein [Rhodoligotrophos appendicifer]|uniref:sensor domain-containing diguanylate cyclase n=1 Tax=Rhodoligotrophos appendicifer TaxID=987056 RepID=UPI0011866A84|nr:GGDEF domain-containing protein [Rhodoligotrophos appendicifer]
MTISVEELFEKFERAPVLLAVYDSFDRLRYANQAFREAYFVERDEEPFWSDLMRRNYEGGRGTVLRTKDFDQWLISTQSRRGKAGYRALETDLLDGRWLWMTETVDADGWMLCIATDITALRTDERSIRQDRDEAVKASHTDFLTGVANRRYLTIRLGEMICQPAPEDADLGCFAILDLDNFKYVNDRFGHQAGDLILRDFAQIIQTQLRRKDCFGRFGGEEFALVFPATTLGHAELIIERMLGVIRKSRPLKEHPELAYTFSAGLTRAMAGDTIETIWERADHALYSAKMAGRDQVFIEGPDPRSVSWK